MKLANVVDRQAHLLAVLRECQILRFEIFLELRQGKIDILAAGRLPRLCQVGQHQLAVDHLIERRFQQLLPLGFREFLLAVGPAKLHFCLRYRDRLPVEPSRDWARRVVRGNNPQSTNGQHDKQKFRSHCAHVS
jgi:hypothetical protein